MPPKKKQAKKQKAAPAKKKVKAKAEESEESESDDNVVVEVNPASSDDTSADGVIPVREKNFENEIEEGDVVHGDYEENKGVEQTGTYPADCYTFISLHGPTSFFLLWICGLVFSDCFPHPVGLARRRPQLEHQRRHGQPLRRIPSRFCPVECRPPVQGHSVFCIVFLLSFCRREFKGYRHRGRNFSKVF